MSLAISLSDTSLPSCFSDVPVPFFTSVCVCRGGGVGGEGGESAGEREWEREREGWRERKIERERVNK